MPSNHLILCCPLLLLPSIFLSIRVFSNELALRIRWPKCWNFSFGISSSNEYAGLTSFRIDWLVLLAVQGTLKSLLQHHNTGSMTGNLQNCLHQGHLPGLLLPVPCPCGEPLLIHTSAGAPPMLAGRSGSASYEVTSPFPCVLVHTRFYLCPPRMKSLSPSSMEIL